jgi:hypothetical protein
MISNLWKVAHFAGVRGLFGLMLALCVSLTGTAQERVYVLCEGAQDFYSGEVLEFPSVGVIGLGGEWMEFEELHSFVGHAFASDLLVSEDGARLYVAAEDTVYVMDAWTGEILAEQALDGARKLALHEDRLFVSRGDYDPVTWGSVAFDAYLVALDAESLSWEADWAADGVAGPAWASEGVRASNGGLFVAVNNAFDFGEEVGLIGRIDLESGAYEEVDLGPAGLNPVHLLLSDDGAVVTVNAQQYDGTSLSRWDGQDAPLTLQVAEVTAGCGAAAWHAGGVLYQVYGEGDFRRADGVTLAPQDGWSGNGLTVYSMTMMDGDQVLLGMTDFVGSGEVECWNMETGSMWTLPVGVAPGKMVVASTAMDVPVVQMDRTWLGTYDVMGRPAAPGAAGLTLTRWADGRVTKRFTRAD